VPQPQQQSRPEKRQRLIFDFIETAAQVLDSVMGSATPNPLVAEEAMRNFDGFV
jgi:hypothetical protein